MRGEPKSLIGKRLQTAAEEEAWSRAVVRAAVLIALALGAAWWWRDRPWPGAGGMIPAGDGASDLVQRQAVYLGWAALVMLMPAFYAFWARNRSGKAARTWRSHWTLGYWMFVLHLAVSFSAAGGVSVAGLIAGPWQTTVAPCLAVALWWLGDIAVAARQQDESQLAGVQRVALSLAVLVLFAAWTFRGGEPLAGMILCAALIAAAAISAQDAWKKRGRA